MAIAEHQRNYVAYVKGFGWRNRSALGRENAKVSPKLQDIILKCLDKEPENRYQSAKEPLVVARRYVGQL